MIELGSDGFIPGPFEDEQTFLKRVDYCRQLRTELDFKEIPQDALDESFAITKPLFGIAPSWIAVSFSNHQLPFWVGGCAWIFQQKENSPTGAFIQLRNSFKHSAAFLFYTRKELMAHELAHVGRMAFEEPKYEEVLAYRTAPTKFRKFLGPLFTKSSQMMLFMTVMIFIFLVDLGALWWGGWSSYIGVFPLKLIPLGALAAMLGTLVVKQLKFSRLEKRFPLPFLYCLTDLEIDSFDKMSDEQVKTYASQQCCPRWQLLKTRR